MKANSKIIMSLISVFAMSACTVNVEPVQLNAPEVTFPMTEADMTAVLGEEVTFVAEINAGDKLKAGWYINGTLMASGEVLKYTFSEAGTYTVKFEARNGKGIVSKEYTVKVADMLKMHLSVEDSTEVSRLQGTYLQLMAVVDYGANVTHKWSVDGNVESDKAYFNTFFMPDVRQHTVTYEGVNPVGSYTKTFTVNVTPRPLFVEFSVEDASIAAKTGTPVELTATVKYGEQGLSYEWFADGQSISKGSEIVSEFSHSFDTEGTHTITYKAVNEKGEKFEKNWTVTATLPGIYLVDSFEGASELGSWWRNGNNPGISIVDNPDKSGINTSDKVIIDQVSGNGGTSGYFTLVLGNFTSGKDIDFSKFKGMRFKVHLGQNKYYPKISVGSAQKKPSVSDPKFENTWEIITYDFEANGITVSNNTEIQIRPMSQKNGDNITGGSYDDPENSRTVYIDDVEFLEVL